MLKNSLKTLSIPMACFFLLDARTIKSAGDSSVNRFDTLLVSTKIQAGLAKLVLKTRIQRLGINQVNALNAKGR